MKQTRWMFAAAFVMAAVLVAPLARAEAPKSQPAKPIAKQNPPAGVRIERDVKYGDAPGVANLLDVYLPEKAEGELPLIIWIHGGGWQAGDKAGCPAVGMVGRGYVAASLNYRFSQEAIFPAQIEDCKGAIRFLRAHAKEYHIDPNRIGVWGASAGGHLVALLGTSGSAKEIEGTVGGNLDQTSRVEAVCDWFGPTDMSRFWEEAGTGNIFKPNPAKSPIDKLFGGPVSEKKDLVAKANPLTFVSKESAPFLIIHGDHDKLVPVAQSQILNDALKAAGVESELVVLEGAGHGGPQFTQPKVLKQIADFFDKHLNPTAKPVELPHEQSR
ncbi:MAG TPA: alpha/beta hydrolase [Tepidisphaeraceae bacterium]|nr:alpha/beta hydrolase [Tepidisphaeraceae bacterium]